MSNSPASKFLIVALALPSTKAITSPLTSTLPVASESNSTATSKSLPSTASPAVMTITGVNLETVNEVVFSTGL